jgi:transposase
MLVYIDESGVDSHLHKEYCWAPKGQVVLSRQSGKRFARESFLAAKCGKKILAPMCFNGTCNTELFNAWLEQMLVPELIPGQILIMDNASFHKSSRTKSIIEAAGCKLKFLPAYSPDLNPIENFWALLKAKLKSYINKFASLAEAIDYSLLLLGS